MTHSRVPHVSLTEPVRETMSGKGREGKGSSWSSNTTSSGYVTREPGDVLVSATRLDEHTDLTTIEHLDFSPDIPCECFGYVGEDKPCPRAAHFVLRDSPCVACGLDEGLWLCSLPCWMEMGGEWGVACPECETPCNRDKTLRIVEVLR